MNNDIKEVLFSNKEIVQICQDIAKKIDEEYKDSTPIIVSLLSGSVPFVAELIKHITIPVKIDFMCVKSYFGGTSSSGRIMILSDVTCDVKDKDIIIFDDIIDTGKTMRLIREHFINKGVKSVKIGCMLEKKSRHEVVDFPIDYVGAQVANQFVVGFGLDYKELYRNLPYVGILKEEVYTDDEPLQYID